MGGEKRLLFNFSRDLPRSPKIPQAPGVISHRLLRPRVIASAYRLAPASYGLFTCKKLLEAGFNCQSTPDPQDAPEPMLMPDPDLDRPSSRLAFLEPSSHTTRAKDNASLPQQANPPRETLRTLRVALYKSYYVLIAACVFARKAEWLRNVCLAAALLLPAVAAFHGITLAALHVDGAVDMDIFGAFQLCSIGVLAAPVTVKLSRTYFYDPGRNTIFLWTVLLLAGLLSLTVEFFRINTSGCTQDNSGNPISSKASLFPYNDNPTCGLLNCIVGPGGLVSPMRGGSANNIYVIPAPDMLSFNTATLLAAACCVPAVLSLVSMWNKILKINWKSRFGDEDEKMDEPISGTNGATEGKMRKVNGLIRFFLSAIEIPVFGAAVFAILIIGERNFWSQQVRYQTEPIATIGQWSPIVTSGLAALGSLYLLLSKEEVIEKKEDPKACMHHCNCSTQEANAHHAEFMTTPPAILGPDDMRRSFSGGNEETLTETAPTTTQQTLGPGHQLKRSWTNDAANRRRVANALTSVGNYLGTAAPDRFDDSEFKQGKAVDFPEIPGEDYRNSNLPQIREQYNPTRDASGNATPSIRAPSRTGSVERSSSRAASPQSPRSPHASTFPVERPSLDISNSPTSPTSPSFTSPRGRPTRRRDTLEVPSPTHLGPMHNNNYT
ncbi:hypothetical protein G7Y89_g14633 [Cudoniella acicularis]|uniref:Uncharacterized protein n=1 Tax=Cudoniella acicularis TaxID=354080 RepID=A0A8H4VRX5_9HELO|nr:hypothetical protein G7Y89_g14633 [Cudoniella acicularis]